MLAKKIAFNVVFNSIFKVIATALALVGIGFLTRYLGKEGFGNYSTILAFLSLFSALADLGLYTIATREISREGANESKIIGNVLSLRILTGVVIILIAPLLAFFLPYGPEVKRGIMVAAVAFLFSSSYLILNGIFQKNLVMHKVVFSETIGKLVQVALVILAVKKDLGFNFILLSFFLGILTNFLLVFLFSRRYIKLSLQWDFDYLKHFLKESFPMGISAIVVFLYFKMDTILLSVLKDSAAVGAYNGAYKVIENLTFFPGMIMGLIFPLFSRFIFTNKERFKEIANHVFKIFFIMVIPLVITTLFLANQIVHIIGGESFLESANTLRILVFALALVFFGSFLNNILIAANLQRSLMKVLFLCAVLNITANIIFIPIFSYQGAAVISSLTEMLVVVLVGFVVYRKIKYFPKLENFSRILISGAMMTVALYFLSNGQFFLPALGGMAVYFLALWITRAVTREDLMAILSRKVSDESDLVIT